MKSMTLTIILLSSPLANAVLPNQRNVAYQLNDEHCLAGGENGQQDKARDEAQEEQEEIDFDALMSDEDIPSDMIPAAKPVSACEAYFKEIGITLFMKYIALKIWVENQLKSSTKSA